jgi:prepilin signal peptidase PulO-like enzyme (type II secretory pathway)
LVELGTAALFVASYIVAGNVEELLLLFLTMSILVTIVVYDVRHFIIPDKLTITLTLVATMRLLVAYFTDVSPSIITTDVLAALAGTGFFFLLWFVSKGRWLGFGDVKLAFPLGLFVGAPFVFSMIVFSFWIGAAISLVLLGLGKIQRGKLYLRFGTPKLTIKSVVPFAPFLIAGCLLVLFTHINVLSLFTF